jgi:hypothetical protein
MRSLSRMLSLVVSGFGAALVYGLAGTILIYTVGGRSDAQQFLRLYTGPFNSLVTLGLGAAIALIIRYLQHAIPGAIEDTFTLEEVSTTAYLENKQRFYSLRRIIIFVSETVVMAFLVLHYFHFPLSGVAEAVMLIAGCLQAGLAAYAGHKIRYAVMMFYSVLDVHVTRSLLRERKLDVVCTHVQMASILMVIWICFVVRSYYVAPFLYDTFIGESVRDFVLLPAVIATLLLLFLAFYSREVLRKIYDKSVDALAKSVQFDVSPRRPVSKLKIFISYRREDTGGYSRLIGAELGKVWGDEHIFLDVDVQSLSPGTDYEQKVITTIQGCDVVLALIGCRWADETNLPRLASPRDLVRREILTAREHQVLLIPVLVAGAVMPAEGLLPEELQWLERIQAHEISDTRWAYDIGRLVETLRSIKAA